MVESPSRGPFVKVCGNGIDVFIIVNDADDVEIVNMALALANDRKIVTESVHSCSYYCHRPECIRRQRDELRDIFITVPEGRARYLLLGAVLAPKPDPSTQSIAGEL